MSEHHYVEIFTESGAWGWQCLTPDCHEEAVGFEDANAADAAADEHRRLVVSP